MTSDELRFVSSLEGLDADVIHPSGSLQCVSDPLAHLSALLDIGAEWLLFNRLGLSLDSQVVTVHESLLSDNGAGPLPPGIKDRLHLSGAECEATGWRAYRTAKVALPVPPNCRARRNRPVTQWGASSEDPGDPDVHAPHRGTTICSTGRPDQHIDSMVGRHND